MPDIALAVRAEIGSSLGHLGVGLLAGQVAEAAAQYPALALGLWCQRRPPNTGMTLAARRTDKPTIRARRGEAIVMQLATAATRETRTTGL